MTIILPTFYILFLFVMLIIGLLLLALGIVLLLKMKNKLPGGLSIILGVVFTILPILVILAFQIYPTMRS